MYPLCLWLWLAEVMVLVQLCQETQPTLSLTALQSPLTGVRKMSGHLFAFLVVRFCFCFVSFTSVHSILGGDVGQWHILLVN